MYLMLLSVGVESAVTSVCVCVCVCVCMCVCVCVRVCVCFPWASCQAKGWDGRLSCLKRNVVY
jgi:hypothetical protein